MKWTLCVFGKAGSSFASDEVSKFEKRLRPFVSFDIVEIKESKRSDKVRGLDEEADEFTKRFPKSAFTWIALAEEGKLMSTVQLAKWTEQKASVPCVFLIGSAYGISPSIKENADLLLSLSPLTFTHDHARVILAEQLYRCAMVHRNHPYHHV